jgi:ferredoxin
MEQIEYDGRKHTGRLLKYSRTGLKVFVRPENKGAEITNSLPEVQKIKIDPLSLDVVTNVSELKFLPSRRLEHPLGVIGLEFPKMFKRGKIMHYGGTILLRMVKMKKFQPILRLFTAREKVETDPVKVKEMIKSYAESLGYIVGVTRLDRRFVINHDDKIMPYDTVIMLGMEMDFNLCEEIPNPGKKLWDFETYRKSSLMVWHVARYIRKMGYQCHAIISFEGSIKFVPHAINAGLGELGAQGICITPQYGPRQRWCMIGIDADLPIDQPKDYHVADYCDDCLLCIKACPGRAIHKERIWYRGVLKRKNDDTKCFPFFRKYEGCGICIKVCPFNRYGYAACMEEWKKDGTILGKSDAKKIMESL